MIYGKFRNGSSLIVYMAGGWLRTHLALRHGSGFVRWFFILGVSLLVGKMLLA